MQFEELMDKGYLRESMNLCAVPVQLVSKNNRSWRICVNC
jgi:hypothetical protein